MTNPEGGITRYEYGSFQGDYPIVNPMNAGLPASDQICEQTLAESTNPSLGRPLKSVQFPGSSNKVINTIAHGGRVIRQVMADGSEMQFRYKVIGGCVGGVAGSNKPLRTCSAINDSCEISYERALRGEHVYGGQIIQTTMTDPKGRETTQRYTPQGTANIQISAQGQVASYPRDKVGRLSATVGILGAYATNTFDVKGNQTRKVDILGRITDITYDAAWNKPNSITRYLDSGNGSGGIPISTTNTYHPTTGNLMTTTNAEGQTATYTYNSRGQVLTVTNPLGHQTSFTYNTAGDLTRVTDPLNNATNMEPDLAGRTTRLTDPLGYTTRIERNNLDQTTKIIDANLGETILAYNGKHSLASVKDALNQTVEAYQYDEMDRPTTRTDASGKLETTTYDQKGNATNHTDRRGQAASMTFDEMDRPITSTYADGSSITNTYDALGRLVKLVRNGGSNLAETFVYQLDAADRLQQLTRTAGTTVTTLNYQYDSLNRVTSRQVNGEPTVKSQNCCKFDSSDQVFSPLFGLKLGDRTHA